MEQKIRELSRENLQDILLKLKRLLSEEQLEALEQMVAACETEEEIEGSKELPERMSTQFVSEKMRLIEEWMCQMDEGDLYLAVEEYEDYSDSYWDRDWVTEYYDNQDIGAKLEFMLRFAGDCVADRKYREAKIIYDWIWKMSVSTDSEFEFEPVGLEVLLENGIIHADLEQAALKTLYVDYQFQEPEKRAENLYDYFSIPAFSELQIQDMFHAGREQLKETEQFWKDWIALLQTKSGEMASRLLQEAVLYRDGVEGLAAMAEQNGNVHPGLYLTALQEYRKQYAYEQIEELGKRALDKLDHNLKIRSKIALTAGYASACLGHEEEQMLFSWECFCSESTDRNFLRLFGTEKMAEKYGLRGKEVLSTREKGDRDIGVRNRELEKNWISDEQYYRLCFYTGDFQQAKNASKNPKSSLGWSGGFIDTGIRLILLYLYENPLPSRAAADMAERVGFKDDRDLSLQMDFEKHILEESGKRKISTFWNYFQRWKQYFVMSEEEKNSYLTWAENIVRKRADAIVSNQYRSHYGEAANLLAMVGEIKEIRQGAGRKQSLYQEYRKKFPRHSSFQSEMRKYFLI